MAELENKKFVYKKDRMDWVMIGILIFSLACFGLIFYGLDYFERTDAPQTESRNNVSDLVNNKEELERQLREYTEDQNVGN